MTVNTQSRTYNVSLFYRILSMLDGVCSSSSLPDEMLYGRAGYLYTLIYLRRELGEASVPQNAIDKV